mmetsp:Transcript_3042/g.3732  ORF Transcript_3042/g.3732 Transcript_3042/m.3732 type:complete len:186 (-) Transcript_3042:321-878(-)
MKKKCQTSEVTKLFRPSIRGIEQAKITGTTPYVRKDCMLTEYSQEVIMKNSSKKEESKRDYYCQADEIPEKSHSSGDSSDSSEEEEEESENSDDEASDEQNQIDILFREQQMNKSEDQASITVIGNNRKQERTEQTVVQNTMTIYKIKYRNRIDMSLDEEVGSSENNSNFCKLVGNTLRRIRRRR